MDFPEILRHSYPDGDPDEPLAIADRAEAAGDLRLAATALDRVYGLVPDDATIRRRRQRVLDSLAVEEHGLVFRYVPAGVFLIGSEDGEPDEKPVHARFIEAGFWLTDTTISWAAFCRLMNWAPPPLPMDRLPKERFFLDLWGESARWTLAQAREVRLQYCEDVTRAASNWHRHDPIGIIESSRGLLSNQEAVGFPDRPADAPWRYETKPMVAVSSQEAEALAASLSTWSIRYSLPTDAQWEKAARAGLIGCRYAWGNEPPTPERCDFGRFEPFVIRPPRTLPPNGYGLYGMCGSVWEWTSDCFWVESPQSEWRRGDRILRGGSWTDPAEVVTVSFRMSRHSDWSHGTGHITPNIGFRLCREERDHSLRVP